jgi:hypothetical protein
VASERNRMMKLRHVYAIALLVTFGWGQALCHAQAPDEKAAAASGAEQQAAPKTPPGQPGQTAADEKRGELAVAPIPVVDPTIGNGLAVGVLYTLRLQKEDTVSPPSTFGAGGMHTSNGTWGILGGGQFYLKQDRFRIVAVAGTANVHLNYYGIGNEAGGQGKSVAITQSGSGFMVGGLVRTFERWFVGSRYYYFKLNTGLDNKDTEAPEPIREVQIKMPVAALGLHVQRDTRKSQFYPRTGSVFDTKLDFSSKSVGALFTYQDYGVSFEQFFKLGERQVLAYRVKACAVNGHAPFFAVCSLGNSADMRGYPVGRYRDRRMLVGQVEYRHEIWWRFGAVAFVGAGEVASTFADFNFSNARPGGGAGMRFAVAPKNHINIRVDYGVGQGSHAWYVGVGEAF